MRFNVPQFVGLEDKIAFQLTAKQLGWFGSGGIALFLIWNFVSQGVFIIWAIIISLVVLLFAFYRPQGISLISFVKFGFSFLIKPKIYIWNKEYKKGKTNKIQNLISKDKKNQGVIIKRKPKNLDKIVETLDSQRF